MKKTTKKTVLNLIHKSVNQTTLVHIKGGQAELDPDGIDGGF